MSSVQRTILLRGKHHNIWLIICYFYNSTSCQEFFPIMIYTSIFYLNIIQCRSVLLHMKLLRRNQEIPVNHWSNLRHLYLQHSFQIISPANQICLKRYKYCVTESSCQKCADVLARGNKWDKIRNSSTFALDFYAPLLQIIKDEAVCDVVRDFSQN